MFAYSLQQLSELDDTALDRMMKNDSTFGKLVQKIKDFFYDFVSLINGEDVDTIRMRNYARKMADRFNNNIEDFTSINDPMIWRSKDLALEKLVKEIKDKVLNNYEITNVHDFVHVQKRVKETLESEGYFEDVTHINESTGMIIKLIQKRQTPA